MKTALGRGLDALIPEKGQEIVEIEISRIVPGPQQPRRVFKEEPLKELAESIKEKGVLQPVLVTRRPDGSFSLIAGERRFRASRSAGLKKIPAIIRQAEPEDALEISLIENIQRENLNPIETAHAFQQLSKKFGLTQEQLASKVGKDRATVANYIRLLKLPDDVKKLLAEGSIDMGHARALLSIENAQSQRKIARLIASKGLSVREVEKLAGGAGKTTRTKTSSASRRDPNIASLEEKLIRSLGTKVMIKHKGKRGKIEIEYYSLEELDRLLDVFLGTK